MTQKKNYWVLILLFLLVIFALGFFLWKYQGLIKSKIFKDSDTTQNIVDKLFGPIRETRAKTLTPEQIIYWTNFYRKQYGLTELSTNSELAKAAQIKVDDMFTKQYFEHVSPSGVTPAEVVSSTGYQYKETGENLALGDFLNEKDLVDAWMNSPGHRANILNKDFTEIGVATGLGKYQDRPSTWLAVQEFGKPMPKCSKPSQNTLNEINTKKSELDALNAQIKSLPAGTTQEQANELIAQAQALYNEIQSETNSYNAAVEAYNSCIAQ